MLENWFTPIAQPEAGVPRSGSVVAAHIRTFSGNKLPDLKKIKVAIVGLNDEEADAVRRQFYAMAYPWPEGAVLDLGNIRKNNASFFIPALAELAGSRIFPIVIGRDPAGLAAQFKALQAILQHINLVVFDERLDLDLPGDYLREILVDQRDQVFQCGLLGFQSHFVLPETLAELETRNYDLIRLGQVRSDLENTEPIIRDADLVGWNLRALDHSSAPGAADLTPSGFQLEEACRLSRYAGISDKLKMLGIFGFHAENDRNHLTAQGIAQMIWYFLDGFFQRKGDFPASTNNLTEYIVQLKQLDFQLTFWKSSSTGRWWMQVPVKTRRNQQRHRMVPCSFSDYQMACKDELPERLFQALRRFG